MIKAGITGGIGSGKSTACRKFEELGVPVYYADDRAKWLMQHNEQLKALLIEAFGEAVYGEQGQLDRAYLGKLVFNDKAKLEQLNGLVHPVVIQDGRDWMSQQLAAGHAYCLKEAALLFESGTYEQLDQIIVVAAPEELRIQRVMQRDDCSRKEVLSRMRHQMPQAEKEARADFLIHNIELEGLAPQVQAIHEQLLEMG